MDAKQELINALVEAGLSPEQAQNLIRPYRVSRQDETSRGSLKKRVSAFLAANGSTACQPRRSKTTGTRWESSQSR